MPHKLVAPSPQHVAGAGYGFPQAGQPQPQVPPHLAWASPQPALTVGAGSMRGSAPAASDADEYVYAAGGAASDDAVALSARSADSGSTFQPLMQLPLHVHPQPGMHSPSGHHFGGQFGAGGNASDGYQPAAAGAARHAAILGRFAVAPPVGSAAAAAAALGAATLARAGEMAATQHSAAAAAREKNRLLILQHQQQQYQQQQQQQQLVRQHQEQQQLMRQQEQQQQQLAGAYAGVALSPSQAQHVSQNQQLRGQQGQARAGPGFAVLRAPGAAATLGGVAGLALPRLDFAMPQHAATPVHARAQW